MKVMFLGLIAAVSASAMTPTPAEAQRWRDDRGWHEGRGRYRHDGRYHYAPRGHYRGRYWEGRRWRGRGSRMVCRWRRGPYGQRRICYRVRR